MEIVQKKQQETQNNQFHLQGLSNFKPQSTQNPVQQNIFLQTQNLQPFHQQQQMPMQQQQTNFNLNTNFPNNNTNSNFFNQLVNKPPQISFPQSPFNSLSNFSQLANNSSLTNTGIFNSNQPSGNSFIPQNSQANPPNKNASSIPFYSTPHELTEQDMKSFNASSFSLGKIPRNPPPQNLC